MEFWRDRRVFVTGHTGFKGTWITKILKMYGANVTGYSSGFPTEAGERLFHRLSLGSLLRSVRGDVRDLSSLHAAFEKSRPEVVIHLAAQPIVSAGYKDPVGTYSTNVMGTVNLLECVRRAGYVKSVLIVTTDKVYEDRERDAQCRSRGPAHTADATSLCPRASAMRGYRETDTLGGRDPYANSKSCAELVTCGYRASFFDKTSTAVSTARAGNVIGGGDFSPDRIVPDSVRAAARGEVIGVRHPESVRPYQHVLDALFAYLMIAEAQYGDKKYAGEYNVGPDDGDVITTGELADKFCAIWGEGQTWERTGANEFSESWCLRLDNSRLKRVFGWRPVWGIDTALEKTVEWAKAYNFGGDIAALMEHQIREFADLSQK